MILYHGSYLEVQTPDLVHSRENLDFGRGFYTTPLYEQAISGVKDLSGAGKEELFLTTVLTNQLIRDLKF